MKADDGHPNLSTGWQTDCIVPHQSQALELCGGGDGGGGGGGGVCVCVCMVLTVKVTNHTGSKIRSIEACASVRVWHRMRIVEVSWRRPTARLCLAKGCGSTLYTRRGPREVMLLLLLLLGAAPA